MENTRTKILTVPVFVAARGVSPAIHAAVAKADDKPAGPKVPEWLKKVGSAELIEAA